MRGSSTVAAREQRAQRRADRRASSTSNVGASEVHAQAAASRARASVAVEHVRRAPRRRRGTARGDGCAQPDQVVAAVGRRARGRRRPRRRAPSAASRQARRLERAARRRRATMHRRRHARRRHARDRVPRCRCAEVAAALRRSSAGSGTQRGERRVRRPDRPASPGARRARSRSARSRDERRGRGGTPSSAPICAPRAASSPGPGDGYFAITTTCAGAAAGSEASRGSATTASISRIGQHALERAPSSCPGLPCRTDVAQLRRASVPARTPASRKFRGRGSSAAAAGPSPRAVVAVAGRAALHVDALAASARARRPARMPATSRASSAPPARRRAPPVVTRASASAASSPAASSAASSSKPPIERPSMKICGTVRRPVRCDDVGAQLVVVARRRSRRTRCRAPRAGASRARSRDSSGWCRSRRGPRRAG